jgi:heme-degrading monooxygenase HmoA
MNTVHYAEARGEHAGTALRGFLHHLPALPGFLGAELLSSPEQPGLYLVASRWAGPVPPLDLPAGTRAWTFTVLDAR